MTNPRLKDIYDEIEKLKQNDEEPEEWVGFVNPLVFSELSHPSVDAATRVKDGITKVFVAGVEVRPNELVDRGECILINRELIHDEEDGEVA